MHNRDRKPLCAVPDQDAALEARVEEMCAELAAIKTGEEKDIIKAGCKAPRAEIISI